MKIQVLGVGGAFAPKLGKSSFILWDDKKTSGTLVDCGFSVFATLEAHNVIDKIDTVFITHLHSDHAGSLDTLLQYRRHKLRKKTRVLELTRILPFLKEIDPAYANNPKNYFNLENTGEYKNFLTNYVKHSPNQEAKFLYTQGILISGDTSGSLLSMPLATSEKTKIILHDVSFARRSGGVHALYQDLLKAKASIRAKTWLYHYEYGDFSEHRDQVKLDGFAGLLMTGQVLWSRDE